VLQKWNRTWGNVAPSYFGSLCGAPDESHHTTCRTAGWVYDYCRFRVKKEIPVESLAIGPPVH
jgi:hypothetical protein